MFFVGFFFVFSCVFLAFLVFSFHFATFSCQSSAFQFAMHFAKLRFEISPVSSIFTLVSLHFATIFHNF